jgi:hypothetical protein
VVPVVQLAHNKEIVMKESMELATTVPHNEECAQLGCKKYDSGQASRLEARALINQIIEEIGAPPVGAGFKVVKCPHDFGAYYDVAIVYDPENDEATDYAFKVETEIPEQWSGKSKEYLKENGYPKELQECWN